MEENNKKKNNSFSDWIKNNKVDDGEGKVSSSPSDEFDSEFGDFEFDIEGFEQDQQLTIVDEVSLEILERIKEYAGKIIDNIKYQEKSDAKANFDILANYCTGMAQIMSDDSDNDEQVLEKIRELKISVANITFNNMSEYAQEFKDIDGTEVLDICEDSEEESSDKNDDDDLF